MPYLKVTKNNLHASTKQWQTCFSSSVRKPDRSTQDVSGAKREKSVFTFGTWKVLGGVGSASPAGVPILHPAPDLGFCKPCAEPPRGDNGWDPAWVCWTGPQGWWCCRGRPASEPSVDGFAAVSTRSPELGWARAVSSRNSCPIPTYVDGGLPSHALQGDAGGARHGESACTWGVHSLRPSLRLCKPRHLYLLDISECPVQPHTNMNSSGNRRVSIVSPAVGES